MIEKTSIYFLRGDFHLEQVTFTDTKTNKVVNILNPMVQGDIHITKPEYDLLELNKDKELAQGKLESLQRRNSLIGQISQIRESVVQKLLIDTTLTLDEINFLLSKN